ncbi:cupin domain-containing protein [Anaerolinea thermophila]|uniref:Ethanolamine utilisation EutQ n=1 Tax=Anaerolinea thermophila (strain DSM 14523 / JCM 11388 / NBRC 100420 / UNI-1) TaxID=926569 RepID=E8N2F2_ANATU|nr:cupin domain-containing protein [Anaerolinea thermophila]BAJ62758.1 ethanolamine utilisation EutQ [Anaerolinea thermophila UNI-1]
MAKKCYTAQDVRSLADQKVLELKLSPGELITPLARDAARELGIKIIEVEKEQPGSQTRAEVVSSSLEEQVRQIVGKLLEKGDNSVTPKRASVVHVDGRSLVMPPFSFEINRPEMDVRLEDVITAQHGSPMAAGFMTLHKGSFPWTLTYDEIEFVIEGELHIATDQGTVVGKPGDVIFIPKGTKISFGTPQWAKFLYVTYPAEWAG